MENNIQPTDINVGQLEFKHIAKYLPYGLKIETPNQYITDCIGAYSQNGVLWLGFIKTFSSAGERIWFKSEDCKLYLRSPDLTKPITHKGETFVPLLKLAEIFKPQYKWYIEDVRILGDKLQNIIFIYDNIGLQIGYFKHGSYKYQNATTEELLEKLAEWMFDTRGLIKIGLAVDVETLDTNPYQ